MSIYGSGPGTIALAREYPGWVAKCQLRHSSTRLFFFILGNLEPGNYFTVTKVQIANDLEINKSTVDRALLQLKSKEILFDDVIIGRFKRYKLNPHIAWCGDMNYWLLEKNKYPVPHK